MRPQVDLNFRSFLGSDAGVVVSVELEPLDFIGCHVDEMQPLHRGEVILREDFCRRAGYAPVANDHLRSKAIRESRLAR